MNQKPSDQPSCSSQNDDGWVVRPSKTFAGRYYYFNVLTGVAAWCPDENDKANIQKRANKYVSMEPSSPPPPEAESPNTSQSTSISKPIFTPRGNIHFENRYPQASTSFGVATFPQYFPIQEPYSIPAIPYPSNFWGVPNQQMYFTSAIPFSAPVLSMPSREVLQNKQTSIKKSFNKVTQTSFRERPDCVQTTSTLPSEISGHTNISDKQRSFVPVKTNTKIIPSKGGSDNKVTQTSFRERPDCVQTTSTPPSEISGHTNIKLPDNQHRFEPLKKNAKIIQSKGESDKTTQQTIPNLTKIRTLTKSESIETNIGVENCKCMQQDKKITMSEKTEFIKKSDDSTTQESKSSEDVKLLEPFANLMNHGKGPVITGNTDINQRKTASGENYDLNEKFIKTVQIVNQSPQRETEKINSKALKRYDLPDADKEGFKGLKENDLRFILLAKRRKTAPPNTEAGVKIKVIMNPLPIPAKKKVTFDIPNPESLDSVSSASRQTDERSLKVFNQEVFNPKQDLYNTTKLRNLSKLAKNGNWFIVVDLQVLIHEFALLEGLVNSDKQCRIQIPATVHSQLNSLCKGDSRARPQAMAARHVARHVASNQDTFIVEVPIRNFPVDNEIIQCCYKIIHSGHHTILLSNNTQLRLKAKDIYCLSVQELKNLVTPKQNATFDSTSIKTTVQNESAQKPLSETTFRPIHTDNGILFSTADANEVNPSTSLTKEKQTQKDEMKTKIDAQTSPIIFNSPYQSAETTSKRAQPEKTFAKNDTKTTKDIIEEELEKFATKHKELGENLNFRKQEGIVCFVQIMEDVLNYILQTKNSLQIELLPPPWILDDAIECLKRCYQHDEKIKTVCEKFLEALKPNTKSCDFLRLAGCGILLLEALKKNEPVDEAMTSLAALLVQLTSPVHEHELAVITRVCDKNDTLTEERHEAFVKMPSDVIDYLKRHYPAWEAYDNTTECSQNAIKMQDIKQVEATNPQKVKIIRTFGRDLKNFRIHSKKPITVETKQNINLNDKALHEYDTGNTFNIDNNDEKTALNIVREVGVIKEFEEKLKPNSDVDSQANSEVLLNDINDNLLLKDLELSEITTDDENNGNPNEKLMNHINDNETYDSDNEKEENTCDNGAEISNESLHVRSVVRMFLDKLTEAFKEIHGFIEATRSELGQYRGLKLKRKYVLYGEVKQALTVVADIMDTLRSIRDREKSENTLEAFPVQANHNQARTYRQIITKFLERFKILWRSLRMVKKLLHRHILRRSLASLK